MFSLDNIVQLDQDHPGFRDATYRARRDAIARIALAHESGAPVPHAPYSDAEHGVWALILGQLAPLHRRLVCRELNEVSEALALPVLGAAPGAPPARSSGRRKWGWLNVICRKRPPSLTTSATPAANLSAAATVFAVGVHPSMNCSRVSSPRPPSSRCCTCSGDELWGAGIVG